MESIKLVTGICAIVAAIYLIVVLTPPYLANYRFEDAIKTEAQLGTYSTKSEEAIRDSLFKKAQDLDVPIAREQIKVQRSGVAGAGSLSIDAPYIVHVNLPGYPLDLHFDASTRNKSVF